MGFWYSEELFQFHKGAIGVAYDKHTKKGKKLFQFHKGAIGVPRCKAISLNDIHFNSIKVRLESIKKGMADRIGFYFNSIKVRLECQFFLYLN